MSNLDPHRCTKCGRLELSELSHALTDRDKDRVCRRCYRAAYPPSEAEKANWALTEASMSLAKAFGNMEQVLDVYPELAENITRIQSALINLRKAMDKRAVLARSAL